jgi:hypothetical protein
MAAKKASRGTSSTESDECNKPVTTENALGKKLASEATDVARALKTAEMYQDAAMQWGAWGGWDAGWGPMGLGVGVGRFR